MKPRANTKPSVVDELLDRYLSWREECAALDAAYDRWRHAADIDRELAFAAYSAQLDLEEQAAREYERSAAAARAETDRLAMAA
jgi:hypothetical protein